MANEFLKEIDVNRNKISKKEKKCCYTGIHDEKSKKCIQSMRPFKDNIQLSKNQTDENKFVKEILANRNYEKMQSEYESEINHETEDPESTVNFFSKTFGL